MPKKVDLSSFNNSFFNKGASSFKIALWTIANYLILKNNLIPFSFLKLLALRLLVLKLVEM